MEVSEVVIRTYRGEPTELIHENTDNLDLQDFMEMSFAVTVELYFDEGGKVEDINQIIFTWKS